MDRYNRRDLNNDMGQCNGEAMKLTNSINHQILGNVSKVRLEEKLLYR